jgi:hypothetical protein
MIKVIVLAVIILNYINNSNGINIPYGSPILKCKSAPNLALIYNTTNCNNDIILCCEFKSVIKNKYRRNMYLRSKEKYNYDTNK